MKPWRYRDVAIKVLTDSFATDPGLSVASLVGPCPRCVESMPAGGAETERLQELL